MIKPILGWREWVALPQWNISKVKCKVDTGAKTSALHAFEIIPFEKNGQSWLKIGLHPDQLSQKEAWIEAPVKDIRKVTDSGGHTQERYFIETQILLGSALFTAELSLTSRDNMRFRMLLGREAMNGRFLVDPQASYLQHHPQNL